MAVTVPVQYWSGLVLRENTQDRGVRLRMVVRLLAEAEVVLQASF